MSDFLKDLTPGKWNSVGQRYIDTYTATGKFVLAHGLLALAIFERESDCDFAALARNAYDVQMRRPTWWVQPFHYAGRRLYKVYGDGLDSVVCQNMPRIRDCPLKAFVDADKWMTDFEKD